MESSHILADRRVGRSNSGLREASVHTLQAKPLEAPQDPSSLKPPPTNDASALGRFGLGQGRQGRSWRKPIVTGGVSPARLLALASFTRVLQGGSRLEGPAGTWHPFDWELQATQGATSLGPSCTEPLSGSTKARSPPINGSARGGPTGTGSTKESSPPIDGSAGDGQTCGPAVEALVLKANSSAAFRARSSFARSFLARLDWAAEGIRGQAWGGDGPSNLQASSFSQSGSSA